MAFFVPQVLWLLPCGLSAGLRKLERALPLPRRRQRSEPGDDGGDSAKDSRGHAQVECRLRGDGDGAGDGRCDLPSGPPPSLSDQQQQRTDDQNKPAVVKKHSQAGIDKQSGGGGGVAALPAESGPSLGPVGGERLPPLKWVDRSRVKMGNAMGKGTFSVVSKAWLAGDGDGKDSESGGGVCVACKELMPKFVANASGCGGDQMKWFVSEACIMSRMDHRHIVRHEGFGIAPNKKKPTPFHLQEFMEGGSLEDVLRMDSRWSYVKPGYSMASATKWCLQVAKAVEYLHGKDKRVVHRDLKPGNILLTDRVLDRADAKIGDFGLAVELPNKCQRSVPKKKRRQVMDIQSTPEQGIEGTSDQSLYDLTGKTGSFMYMAPEVFLGSGYNEKADIFSLGIILLEILTGRLLSDTVLPSRTWEQAEKYAYRVAKGFRLGMPKTMPRKLAKLIEACLAQDPMERPTASKVVQVLSSCQQHKIWNTSLCEPVQVTQCQRMKFTLRRMEKSIIQRLPSLKSVSKTLKRKMSI